MQRTARRESPALVLTFFTISMIAGAIMYAGTGSLIPYLAQVFALPRAQLGFVATAMLAGAWLTNAVAGVICDKFGDKATLLWSGAGMSLALVLAALFPSYIWLLGCMVLYGVMFSASNPAGSHAILFFFSRERRGFAMGIRQTGIPLGGVLGAILLSFMASHFGYRAALLSAAVIVFAICTSAALLYEQPPELSGDRVRMSVLFKDMLHIAREPRLLLVTLASFLLFFVQTALICFLPITLVHAGNCTPALAAIIFASAHLAAVAGRLLWGRWSDRVFRGNRMFPMTIAAVLAAAAAIGVSLTGQVDFRLVMLAAILLGFSGEGWFGLCVIAMAEIGGEEHAGGALGFGLTGTYLAGVLAPLLLGAIAASAGYQRAWEIAAIAAAAAAVPAFLAALNPPSGSHR